ncbi:MAG: hypothetical protein LBI78_04270 [Campylobacteraceae bacterium]|jgi:hypothetical protein|nr:hypothetical protein [Campylobacteraceae bacterium]
MKKILLAVLLLSCSLFAACYEAPSKCAEKYQKDNKYVECYLQDRSMYEPGYFQTIDRYSKCYAQDKDRFSEGYVQDKDYSLKGYVKDKTIFGFAKD